MIVIIDELIDIIYACGLDNHEATQFLNQIAYEISHEGREWGRKLYQHTKEFCIDKKGICPECGSELKWHTILQWSEAWGIPVSEDVGYKYCPDCHWKDDD
jgi:hypothetical protein